MSEERGTLGTSLILFLAGAAVGAAVVALTTPKTGPELRSDLKGFGNRIRNRFTPANTTAEEDRIGV